MMPDHFIGDALQFPPTAIGYNLSQRLAALWPDKALLEGLDGSFDVEGYARAGHCALAESRAPHSQRLAHYFGVDHRPLYRAKQTLFDITWQDEPLHVLIMHWNDGMGPSYHFCIAADSQRVAEDFLMAVCAWNQEVRDEVLVFDSGHWHKDSELFAAIKGATLDNLVLQGSLKSDIYDDLNAFFSARDTYEEYGVPWKRGVLLVGPPGNGKTHAVKALVNALGQPCLYVKSFRSQGPDEFSIRAVFDRARMTTPCILVLEDLDSLVTPGNRSFFLNELDGFAGNTGILTLATTNHPERLDPAIVDRPSRFDRKYPFDLPAVEERRAYIIQWNGSLQPALRLSDSAIAVIAARTDDFSFAYLKELFISSMMRWISTRRHEHGAMDEVMGGQVDVLRAQMVSAIMSYEVQPADESGAFPMHRGVRHGLRHGGATYVPVDEREIPL